MGSRLIRNLVAAVSLTILGAAPAIADCFDNRATIIGDFGSAAFTVTVADDNDSRAQGLMHVPHMPTMSGMLFVYPKPQRATFWMRNTLIGLDMLFVDSSGAILAIHENAIPLDETVIDGGDNVFAVLEVNAGMVDRLGVKTGDILQHPAFGADAIASCD